MNPDQNGVYTNTDGTRYYIDGGGNAVYLSYYNPSTGDYAEQGSNAIYDVNGQNTGRTVASATKQGTTWLDVVNSALNTAGSIWGNNNNNNSNVQPTYIPIQNNTPVQKNYTGWYIFGAVSLAGVIGYFAWKSKNKSGK